MEALWKSGGALETGSRPKDEPVKEWLTHVRQSYIHQAKGQSLQFYNYLEDRRS